MFNNILQHTVANAKIASTYSRWHGLLYTLPSSVFLGSFLLFNVNLGNNIKNKKLNTHQIKLPKIQNFFILFFRKKKKVKMKIRKQILRLPKRVCPLSFHFNNLEGKKTLLSFCNFLWQNTVVSTTYLRRKTLF